MDADGVQTFQAIVTSPAAAAGSGIAGPGLWTWKQQIRRQQGRGLAISLLQSFLEFKRAVLEFQRIGPFQYEEGKAAEERSDAHQRAVNRAVPFIETIERTCANLERNVAEAMIAWDEDPKELADEISGIVHISEGAAATGARSMSPIADTSRRSGDASPYGAFSDDFFVGDEERNSVFGCPRAAQDPLRAKIRQKRPSSA